MFPDTYVPLLCNTSRNSNASLKQLQRPKVTIMNGSSSKIRINCETIDLMYRMHLKADRLNVVTIVFILVLRNSFFCEIV